MVKSFSYQTLSLNLIFLQTLSWLKLGYFQQNSQFVYQNQIIHRRGICGSFFLWLLLIRKSNYIFFSFRVQRDKVFTKTASSFSRSSFWIRKVVIWWLLNDDFRAREKKESQIPRLRSHLDYVVKLKYRFS